MNIGQLFIAELKKVAENKRMLISVIAMVFVPLIYAAIILSPDWGPYDNVDNVPVAVVNNDEGGMSDGEPVNAGDDLVENLKGNPSLGWDFVTTEEAKRGLDNLEYYMVIEVPEDFSANVVTVMDPSPVKPELKYTQNEGLHFMAAQVTEKAIETIQAQLSTQITETYVRNVFDQLGGVTEGFQEAADGSGQIYDGSIELKEGTTEILDNLTGKSGDISTLASGAKELEAGTEEILSNLVGKSGDISKLAAGASELLDGTRQIKAGSTQLLEGAQEAKSGSAQLKAGLNGQLVPGGEELADGVKEAQKGVLETIESIEALHESLTFLSGLDKDHPIYDGILNEVLGQLTESLEEVPQKKSDFQRLVDGANTLRDELREGSEFNAGLTQLDRGLAEIVAGQQELDSGATELVDGAAQVADGNRTVESGWQQLSDGSVQLNDGAQQISDGTATVETGWGDLTDGVSQVDDGVGQIQEGSDELTEGLLGGVEETSQLNPSDENMEMFAAPVELNGEIINSFPFYRDSSAPYVMTLALFAGILAMSFVLHFHRPITMVASGVSLFIGRVMNLSIFAVLQAIIISVFTLVVLQLEVQSSLMFILFSIVVSLTFLALMMFLVALAGNIGRFIALAFIVVQLSTTGSDLPIHMLPEGLRNLSTFLPFTYSIDGYKNIVTLGKFSHVWFDLGVLAIYLVVFVGLSLLVYYFKFREIDVPLEEAS